MTERGMIDRLYRLLLKKIGERNDAEVEVERLRGLLRAAVSAVRQINDPCLCAWCLRLVGGDTDCHHPDEHEPHAPGCPWPAVVEEAGR